MAQENRPAAAVVLYRPDTKLLDALLSSLDRNRRRIFIYANGPIEAGIEARVGALTNGKLIRSEQNAGHGQALNALVEAARDERFECVVIFDQDGTPEPELIDRLYDRFVTLQRNHPRIAVLGPLLTVPPAEHYLSQKYLWRKSDLSEPDRAVDFVPTAGSLVSIEAWTAVGPYRSDYFIGGIDVEWSLRAWSRGYMSIVSCDLPMIHRWGRHVGSTEAYKKQILRQSDTRTFYYVRNTVDCLKLSYIPLRWRLRYAALLLIQILLLVFSRRFSSPLTALLRRAVAVGWNGRMGPIPPGIASDD